MGRPRKWKSDAERKRAERAARKPSHPPDPELHHEFQQDRLDDGEGEIVQTEALESMLAVRAEAEALGRRYGEHEAELRGEEGEKRQGRIERAISYQRFLVEEGRRPA